VTWFRVDDGFYDHPKVLDAGVAAIGLWTLAGAYCARHLTDGVITDRQIRAIGGTRKQAAKLVEVGLWSCDESRADASPSARRYFFNDWREYQPSRADVTTRRQDDAERKRAARVAKADKQGKPENVQPDIQPDGARTPPDASAWNPLYPTRPDPYIATHPEQQSHVSSASERDEPPRGPVVDAVGWGLVRDEIPAEHPHAIRTDLAIRAGVLLKSGTPEADVRAALGLWLAKPALGPGVLPSLVSEIVRNRSRPPAPVASQGSTADQRVAQAQAVKAAIAARLAADPKALEQ